MRERKCTSCGIYVNQNDGIMSMLLVRWFCNSCYNDKSKMDAYKVKAGLADKEARITRNGSMISVEFVKRVQKE